MELPTRPVIHGSVIMSTGVFSFFDIILLDVIVASEIYDMFYRFILFMEALTIDLCVI